MQVYELWELTTSHTLLGLWLGNERWGGRRNFLNRRWPWQAEELRFEGSRMVESFLEQLYRLIWAFVPGGLTSESNSLVLK